MARRFFDQALIVALQCGECASSDKRDCDDIGHRDDEVEVGLAESAIFEIDVDCAERGAFAVFIAANEGRANGIGEVTEVLGALFRRLICDPYGVSLARNEFGERLIQASRGSRHRAE